MPRKYSDAMAHGLIPSINTLSDTLTAEDPSRSPEEVAECIAIANAVSDFLGALSTIVPGKDVENGTVTSMINMMAQLDVEIGNGRHVRDELRMEISPVRDLLAVLTASIQQP